MTVRMLVALVLASGLSLRLAAAQWCGRQRFGAWRTQDPKAMSLCSRCSSWDGLDPDSDCEWEPMDGW